MTESGSPVRLTILSGFAGAGKTTWLSRQLRGVLAEAVALADAGADVPDLVASLSQLCEDRRPPLRIVLEVSGLADPAPLATAIRNAPQLASRLVVSEIVVAVDAVQGMSHLRERPLARAQAVAADCLIVTKVDAGDRGALARLVATLRLLNPKAPIFGASHGEESALPGDDEAAPESLDASALDETGCFATTVRIEASIDWTALALWLSALLHARGDDIVRVRGVVRTPAGRMLVQTRGRVVQTPEILPDAALPSDNQLVIVGRGYRAGDLDRSLRRFAAMTQERHHVS